MEEAKKTFWKMCEMTERDRRNQRKVLFWSLGWVATWLLASFAIEERWVTPGASAVLCAVAPTILGIAMMLAYGKFLREADELQRKIQLEGLALGFGAGLVISVLYILLARAGVVAEAEIANAIAIMVLVYAFGVVLGNRRYV